MSTGYTAWYVVRLDQAKEGGYRKIPTKRDVAAGVEPALTAVSTVVFADDHAEALDKASRVLGCDPILLTASRTVAGYGVGEG